MTQTQTETDQPRRTTRQREYAREYALSLTDANVPLDLRRSGTIGRELRHRAEMQPLVDWGRNEEWS